MDLFHQPFHFKSCVRVAVKWAGSGPIEAFLFYDLADVSGKLARVFNLFAVSGQPELSATPNNNYRSSRSICRRQYEYDDADDFPPG
jgi:hypothetical protein